MAFVLKRIYMYTNYIHKHRFVTQTKRTCTIAYIVNTHNTGFIQARLSKIQGLFKNF